MIRCHNKVESCGDSPESGYTSDHVPIAVASLDEPYDTELLAGDDLEYIGSSYSVNCTLFMGGFPINIAYRARVYGLTCACVDFAKYVWPSRGTLLTLATLGEVTGFSKPHFLIEKKELLNPKSLESEFSFCCFAICFCCCVHPLDLSHGNLLIELNVLDHYCPRLIGITVKYRYILNWVEASEHARTWPTSTVKWLSS